MLSVTSSTSYSVSESYSLLFGFSTPGFLMCILTPGVSISAHVAAAGSVVSGASSMGMSSRSSKVSSLSSCASIVASSSTVVVQRQAKE